MGVGLERRGTASPARRSPVPGFPARLRSALTIRGWTKPPEPRVRFGQPILPGVATIGPADAPLARDFIAEATAVRDGRFTHVGHEIGMRGAIEWFPRGASEAWVTAHHRLDPLLALGVAALVAAEASERRAWYDTASRFVGSWIERVRSYSGPAWGLETLGHRIANLLHLHQLFAAELRDDGEFRRRLLTSIYGQTEYLATAVTKAAGSPALVTAARALVLAGRFFDGLEARGWVEQGTALIWEQLREQVNEDGGDARRSPLRQRGALAEYLEVLAVMKASNDEIPAWARKRVRGMADFVVRVSHPNGQPALFDETPPPGLRSREELLALAAGVLGEPQWALASDLRAIWPRLLQGPSNLRVQQVDEATAGDFGESRALRRTGFYVLAGTPGDAMILDGATQPGSRGHGAYELSVGGVPIIVGGGFTDREPWQAAYFRSPFAQNVLAEKAGGTASALAASVEGTTHWMMRDGLVSFLATWGERRRLVLCLPGRFWLVIDQVNGTGPWAGESLLHLDPACRVEAVCNGRPVLMVSRPPAARCALAFAGGTDVRLVGGVVAPRVQGWVARTPGRIEPAHVIVLPVAGTRPLVAGYAIVPRGTPEVALGIDAESLELRAWLRIGRTEYHLRVLQDEIELRSGVA
ncbi:MAG TPA: heparinase II/III family protein [Candidatus Limnocylindria bacterium]|nr:heparinase II/III family protein [Candidatus Limnocylindria bacterium]